MNYSLDDVAKEIYRRVQGTDVMRCRCGCRETLYSEREFCLMMHNEHFRKMVRTVLQRDCGEMRYGKPSFRIGS